MNITEKITEILRKELETGTFPVGDRFPSETMLADRFGIHKGTANKAVTRLVELGLLKRGVRGAGTIVLKERRFPRGTIGFVAPMERYPFRILTGIQRTALNRGYFAAVLSPPAAEVGHYLSLLDASAIQGLILLQSGLPEVPAGIQVVHVDRDFPDADTEHHSVNCDNFEGGAALMREILRRGHREIAVFVSEPFLYSRKLPFQNRVLGFHKVMRDNGIAECEQRTYRGAERSLPDAKLALAAIRSEYPATTLIATDSDHSAQLMLDAAEELGLKIPENIAITGFGNISDHPFASADQHPEWIGEHACGHLIDMIEGCYRGSLPLREQLEITPVKTEFIPYREH